LSDPLTATVEYKRAARTESLIMDLMCIMFGKWKIFYTKQELMVFIGNAVTIISSSNQVML